MKNRQPFKVSARRDNYEALAGSSVWLMNVCGTRWLEDVPVEERAQEIWSKVVNSVNALLAETKSEIPSRQSFKNIKEHF